MCLSVTVARESHPRMIEIRKLMSKWAHLCSVASKMVKEHAQFSGPGPRLGGARMVTLDHGRGHSHDLESLALEPVDVVE